MKTDKQGRRIWMALFAICSMCSLDARAQSPGCATRFIFCAGCDTFTTFRCRAERSAQFATAPAALSSAKRLWSARAVEFMVPQMRPTAPIRQIPASSAVIHSRLTLTTSDRDNVWSRT